MKKLWRRTQLPTLAVVTFSLFILSPAHARAATFNIADGDVAGLINAINTANSNGEPDTVNLAANGTYTLTAINNTDSNGGSNGLPPILHERYNYVVDLVINGNGATLQRSTATGTPDFRFFQITARVTIKNLILQHGRVSSGNPVGGGAIQISSTLNTQLTLTGCTLNDDVANLTGGLSTGSGGALFNAQNAAVSLTACLFKSCSAVYGGGAIYNAKSGALSLSSCTFNSCDAYTVWSAGNTTVNNCTFTSCSHGPALTIGATSSVTNSLFRQCWGGYYGGAISTGGTVNINGCTFDRNSAYEYYTQLGNFSGNGGAVNNSGTLTLANCTFFQNGIVYHDPDSSGGALYNTGSLAIKNCTFDANFEGGNNNYFDNSIFNDNGTLSVANTLFAGVYHQGSQLFSSPAANFTSQGHNLSDDSAGGDTGTGPGGLLNATGDIRNTDPKLDPAGLRDNGGPTETIALLTGSPAIDQGTSNGLLSDQRGVGYKRTIDKPTPNAAGGDGTDIGAFEFGSQLNVVSSKTHGSAGTFSIKLPAVGQAGVECRSGGASHMFKVVFSFPYSVTVGSVSATPDPKVTSATVGIASSTVSTNGRTVTVNLTSVSNQQTIDVNLFNVSDGHSTNDITVPMAMLLGDVNSTRVVDSTDVTLTHSKIGQAVTSSTFREDVNLEGSINSTDVSTVQGNVGAKLP